MMCYINAWLDCCSPHITIHDQKTGELVCHYNQQEIAILLERGDISLDDLQSSDVKIQEETLLTLVLFKSTYALEQQLHDIQFGLKQRQTVPKAMTTNVLQNMASLPATTSLRKTG